MRATTALPHVPSSHGCQGGNTIEQTARVLIEDVHNAIHDLVELLKTFQSKIKLSKMFLSTLFKRRQEELDAVVDRASMRLQVLWSSSVTAISTLPQNKSRHW